MPTPYTVAATDYLEAGWAPIPLPIRGKWPPPDGYTGANGKYADAEDVKKWCAAKARYKAGNLNSAPGNVALRLPANVLGIDVDAYGEKSGADSLAEAEAEWGCLPATWVATSRTDGLSGIRLFRIPEGLAWPGQVGPGIELIRWDHRYVVAAPSIHDKTHKTYGWFRQVRVAEGDEDSTGYELIPVGTALPEIADLAELPAQWVEGLTEGREWSARAVNESMDAEAVREWLESRPEPNDICAEMRRTITRYSRDIRTAGDDGGAHDLARDGAWAVLGDSKQGHGGVVGALRELRGVFLEAVKRRRGRDDADGERLAKEEWTRAVVRGVQKVSAEGGGTDLDPCASLVDAADLKGGDGTGSRYMNWRLDDIGNAERFIRVANDRARWSEALGGWLLWDDTRWAMDDTRQVERWAVKAVDRMQEELARLEGHSGEGETETQAAQRKAFKAHMKSSGSAGKLAAMVQVARGRKGIVVPSKDFDQHPDLLNTPNGTVILGDKGLDFRDSHRREDYLTMITGVPYEKGAVSEVWENKFLDVVLPDPEERAWVQTLVGYSLYGGNPERVIVIAKGPTTSGKTTFAEVVANALGDYASPYNLSLLKEKMEEGGRADVIDVLNRRFIVASEASAAWNLHADRIKLVTGGEKLSARRLNSNEYIKRVPEFTPWITTNSIPTIPGADQALWRRLKLASFPISIDEDKIDTTLRRRLLTPEAQRAILAWCLDGWERYTRVGLKDAPVAVVQAAMQARNEMNELGQFIQDACEEGEADDGYVVSTNAIFDEYQNWVVENSDERNRYNKITFGRAMGARGIVQGRRYVDGKQQRAWMGIRLRVTRRS
jgi:P4 family phage/plasmid primase-like protien